MVVPAIARVDERLTHSYELVRTLAHRDSYIEPGAEGGATSMRARLDLWGDDMLPFKVAEMYGFDFVKVMEHVMPDLDFWGQRSGER